MIAFGASLSHKTFLITASKCELMPGYVPRMAMTMALPMPAPKELLLTPRPAPTCAATPLPLASPAHHQWGNLWNAILTFSKVSFIAYMRHLRARASVSVCCCRQRRSSLTQPLRCRCSKQGQRLAAAPTFSLPPPSIGTPAVAASAPQPLLGAHVWAIKSVVMCALIIIIR